MPPSNVDVDQEDSVAFKLVKNVGAFGIDGSRMLCGAKQLAQEYSLVRRYKNPDEQVSGLIKWECSKSVGSGFITGLGGLITLPVTIPTGLAASWVIQARLAGTVAELYGHDSSHDRVRTLATLCLLGDAAKEILKDVGVNVANKAGMAVLQRIPGKVFIEINRRVGFRLITKAGEKGVINCFKIVPIIGGLVGGAVDGVTTAGVGKVARSVFANDD